VGVAGILLVREAGGCLNDFLADNGLQKGSLLMAATPELRAKLTSVVSDPTSGYGRLFVSLTLFRR